jgi:hypothetical protein
VIVRTQRHRLVAVVRSGVHLTVEEAQT